jgi:FAD/FMN-containing dehydrogenase
MIRECFAIGGLVGAGAVPAGLARDALLWAARQMPAHDPRRPWTEAELQKQVNQSFDYGRSHPRGGNHGGDFRRGSRTS